MIKKKDPDPSDIHKKMSGFISVTGYITEVPGLFVHNSWDPTIPGAEGLWTVSHMKSGLGMGTFGRKLTAMKFASELAFADWTVANIAPHREWDRETLEELKRYRNELMEKDLRFFVRRMEEKDIDEVTYDSLYWRHQALTEKLNRMKKVQADQKKSAQSKGKEKRTRR